MITHIEQTADYVALVEMSGADLEDIIRRDGLPDMVLVNEETGTVKIRLIDFQAWELYKKQSHNFLMGFPNTQA